MVGSKEAKSKTMFDNFEKVLFFWGETLYVLYMLD